MRQRIFFRYLYVAIAAMSLTGCLGSEDSAGGDAIAGNSGANAAPSIGGNPQSAVRIGDSYSFQPTASDRDGDALTFSVANRPIWANFDSATGRLWGQPTLGNVGVFNNITISVSDNKATTSLSSFSITVTQVALASTTLSWTAPTQNSDGSPLVDLSGYRIYYGQTSREYSNAVDINNPGLTTFVVENLVPGTYYFAATARNSLGVESGLSNEAVKVAN